MAIPFRLIVASVVLFATGVIQEVREKPNPSYAWRLPAGFPVPRVPADNPMSEAKVELGRYLFYDKQLSFNRQQSCASCHEQARAFTDGRATP